MAGLTNTRIKTLRAEEHLKRLQDEIRLFLDEQRITVTKKDDLKEELHIVSFEVDTPLAIPILVGEFAYNLRSGLDQLAWQLARLGSSDPSRDTTFPIHHDRTERQARRSGLSRLSRSGSEGNRSEGRSVVTRADANPSCHPERDEGGGSEGSALLF